ncbi:MAG: FAD-dependent oxidoreductase, partial [Planctomycetota bacterium]
MEARLQLRPPEFYEDEKIELLTGVAATALDPAAKTVTLSDGTTRRYDKLALTTGSRPRRLPASIGGDLPGVFTVRDLADVDAMAPAFREGARVLIVGGGYIGLEAAAVAAAKGLRVTVVEAAERILRRVAAPATSDFFRALHESHGVEIREGAALARLVGSASVEAAELADGERLEVDFVVVG